MPFVLLRRICTDCDDTAEELVVDLQGAEAMAQVRLLRGHDGHNVAWTQQYDLDAEGNPR